MKRARLQSHLIRYLVVGSCLFSPRSQASDTFRPEQTGLPFPVGLRSPELKEQVPQYIEQIKQSLEFLQSIGLSKATPLHKRYFGDKRKDGVYQEVLSKILGALIVKVQNPLLVAYHTTRRYPIIAFTQHFSSLSDASSLVTSSSVLVHEAWHIHEAKKAHYGHVVCPKYDLEGKLLVGHISGLALEDTASCDDHDEGAYVIQMVMLYNIANFCTNCSEEIRVFAEDLSLKLQKRIISPETLELLREDRLQGPN